MDFYDHNPKVYNHIKKVVGFTFFKQIKDTGIVLKSAFKGEDIVSGKLFTLLEYEEDNKSNWMRIFSKNQFILNLRKIAEERLSRIKWEEDRLLKINDTESYGENRYFNETEMTAINISALKDLLELLEIEWRQEKRSK